MPLLEVTASELQMLRESIDAKVVNLEAHRLRTDDPFVKAALKAEVERHILLRQAVVHAGKPAPLIDFTHPAWETRKRFYDEQQTADIEGGLVL